ncbi:hypothetical protein Tco_0701732, partial [Tanacetum coccineum]
VSHLSGSPYAARELPSSGCGSQNARLYLAVYQTYSEYCVGSSRRQCNTTFEGIKLEMISAQIELLTERALIHDAQNKGVQRNQQAFYYLEKAAYQLQPDALYLMGAISLTVECQSSSVSHKQEAEEVSFLMRPPRTTNVGAARVSQQGVLLGYTDSDACNERVAAINNMTAQHLNIMRVEHVSSAHKGENNFSQHCALRTPSGNVVSIDGFMYVRKPRSFFFQNRDPQMQCHANDEEIKLAYGHLAKYYHPDAGLLPKKKMLKLEALSAEFQTESGEQHGQQLLLDEATFKEHLEEEAKAEKERAIYDKELEEFLKAEQAHDELFRMEFGVKSDSEYETD